MNGAHGGTSRRHGVEGLGGSHGGKKHDGGGEDED